MGIFSNICEKCGHSVKKIAMFCSKCGEPAPKGWVKCTSCKKWVGVESHFCYNCKKTLHPSEREMLVNDTLIRPKGIFLQRIEVENLKIRLKDHLILEQGSAAIYMEDGIVVKTIPSGKYNVNDSLLKRIFTSNKAKSLFIFDTADIILPFEKEALRSKEDMEINFYAELILNVDMENIVNIIPHLLKQERQLKYLDIQNALTAALDNSLIKLCNTTTIDDLVKNPNTIINFEDDLHLAIESGYSSIGLKLKKVSSIHFYGKEYDEIREQAGDAEKIARELVIKQRVRQLITKEKMSEFKSQTDIESYMKQLSHEYDINNENMRSELAILKLVHTHEMHTETALHEMDIEKVALEHKLEQEAKKFARMREERKMNFDDDMSEGEKALKLRELKNNLKRQNISENLKLYSNYSAEQLATELPPEQVEQIIKLRELKLKETELNIEKDMTPEQILAKNAKNSDALKTLAAMKQTELNPLAEKLKMSESLNDRMQEIMEKAIEGNKK